MKHSGCFQLFIIGAACLSIAACTATGGVSTQPSGKGKAASRAFMRKAIELACESAQSGGGPFGAVVVKNGKIIAQGSNAVTRENDPTAHAEIVAIRKAAKALGSFDLQGCELYTSCEPCPMCLSAVYWARISKIHYASTRFEAKEAGFDDLFIYEELARPVGKRRVKATQLLNEEAARAFRLWKSNAQRTRY